MATIITGFSATHYNDLEAVQTPNIYQKANAPVKSFQPGICGLMRLLILIAVVAIIIECHGYLGSRWACRSVSSWSGRELSKSHLPVRTLSLGSTYAQRPVISASSSGSKLSSLAVGDEVVGTVEDSDERNVVFRVAGRMATLPTQNLKPAERMALTQVGGLMQLYVTHVDDASKTLGVSLLPLSSSAGVATSTSGMPPSALKNLSPSAGPIRKKQSSLQSTGVLLSNLKTGMKLPGIVSACTTYAAFVDAGVQRSGKGGHLKSEHGMLHKSDIPKSMLTKGAGFSQPLLAAGTPVTVYVKEVFKNSGRFTLTLDPSFEKARVLERKQQTKDAGKERRRARRLRRVLDTVTVGDTVTGVVHSIVPEGVLVTVSSLASLNVTGLLSKHELPSQFSVPGDLKESFQAQLLSQDFARGRQVTCGVMEVNANPSAGTSDEFCLKLMFEEFGAMPDDDLEFTDKMDTLKGKKGRKEALPKGMVLDDSNDDDEEEDEAEEGEEGYGDNLALASDNDLREIYNELRGNKPLMLVQDLYDWADVQDMLAEGDIDEEAIKRALKETKIPASKEIKLGQFKEIIDILQDSIDGISPDVLKAYADDEEDDDAVAQMSDAEIAALPVLPAKMQPAMSSAPAKGAGKAKSGATAAPAAAVDEEGAPVTFSEDSASAIEDEALEEVAQEIFDELRGKSKSLTIKSFKAWSDIEDLKANGLIDDADIQEALEEVEAKTALSFEQFFQAVQILEDIAADKEEGDGKGENEGKGADGEEYFEIDEAEEEAMLTEIFDKLKGKSGKVTLAAFKKWDDVVSMELSSEEIEEAVQAVGAAKNGMTLEQFVAVVRRLDEAEEIEIDDDEEEEEEEEEDEEEEEARPAAAAKGLSKAKKSTASSDTVDEELVIDFDDENMSDEENVEMLKMLFETLRGDKPTVSFKTFMAWDDVQDMMSEGLLDDETLNVFLSEVGVKKGGNLTQDQFIALVTMLDENMRAMGDDKVSDGDGEDEDEGENGDEDDEVPEIDSAELEAVAREIFDELRGKSKALPIKAIKRWTEVQEAVKAGIMTQDTLDIIVKEVAAPGASELTFAEFQQLVELLDQVADAAMGATAEDSAHLKGQSTKSNKAAPSAAAAAAAADKGAKPSASKVSQPLKQQAAADDEDDEDDDSVFDMDDPTPEELEAFTREIYDELKSPKTGKVSTKNFIAWEGVAEVLASGELAKKDLDRVLSEADVAGSGSLSFAQFREVMDRIEDLLNEAEEDDDEEEEEEEAVVFGKGAKAQGKGSSAATSSGQGFARVDDKAPKKGAASKGGSNGKAVAKVEVEDEALEVAKEIFDELRGKRKTLSVKTFKSWEDTQNLIDSGALKRSTLEKALVKVGAVESGEMTLDQFVALVDIIQGGIDEKNLSLDGLDEEDAGGAKSKARIPSSKQGKVLSVEPGEEGETDGDGEGDEDGVDWDEEENLAEMSDEEQARGVFDELRGSQSTLSLAAFIKWEDVQELLDCGALSKDKLAEAIESTGVTVEGDNLTFENVS